MSSKEDSVDRERKHTHFAKVAGHGSNGGGEESNDDENLHDECG